MARLDNKEAIDAEISQLSGNIPDHIINGNDLGTADPAFMLRYILTEIFGKPGLIISELKVTNLSLTVAQPFNLRGVTSKASLAFEDCDIETIELSDASLRSLYVLRSRIGQIRAPRLRLSGSLDLTKQAGSIDFIDLSGAKIGGNLDFSYLTILGIPMPDMETSGLRLALRADGITIDGNLHLREVTANGELRLNGCKVDRNIDLFRCRLSHPKAFALSIAGGNIKGNLGFGLGPQRHARSGRKRAQVWGTLRLSSSEIRGRLDFSELCHLGKPRGNYVIEAEGLQIGSSLSTRALICRGGINLSGSVVTGGWTGENIRLLQPNTPGVVGNGVKFNGLVDITGLFTCGFLSFRRSEFQGGFRLNQAVFRPMARPLSDHGTPPIQAEALNANPFHHQIENWRHIESGLVLDRSMVSGSFEIGACVHRDEPYCPKPPLFERGPTDERDRDVELEYQKRYWTGGRAWLCLDATTIPEIDRTAFRSFKEFDFVDLSNCSYRSVITREQTVQADRESHPPERIRAKLWSPEFKDPKRKDTVLKRKGPKLQTLWKAAATDVVDGSQLDAPDVDGWLRILDATYAPLAYHRADFLPRWAQYRRRSLPFAILMNALLFMSWEAQAFLCLVAFLGLLAVLNPIARHLAPHHPYLLDALQGVAIFLLVLVLGFWLFLRYRKGLTVSAMLPKETPLPRPCEPEWLRKIRMAIAPVFNRGRGMPAERKAASDRIRKDMLRYNYGLKLPVFHPQPYLQLARTIRDDGFDKHAADIVISMEWRRTWYGDLSPGQQFLQWIKGVFLEFGFNRLRPVAWQFLVVLISMVVFQYGYETGAIMPAKSNLITPASPTVQPLEKKFSGSDAAGANAPASGLATGGAASTSSPADALAYVRFNGLLYAAETVIPLTDFGQKKNWIVEPVAGFEPVDPPGTHWYSLIWNKNVGDSPFPLFENKNDFDKALSFHLIAVYSLFVTAFGYLMSVLFVAGITGIITPKY